MNNLKCLKQGFNKCICKRTNKEIRLYECANCTYKEYKRANNNQIKRQLHTHYKQIQKNTKMKSKSNKLAKLEKNRTSLFTSNLDKCYFCPRPKDHMHELFCGRNRQNSMKYGLCLPICWQCHEKYQNNTVFNEEWHKKGQVIFNQAYPTLSFEDTFKINYL